MRSSTAYALAASISTASAVSKGFNYGSTFTDGTPKVQSDFESEFTAAKGLVGTTGFTSARLYTTVQTGGGPISAIPAAISTETELLLGIWTSGDPAGVDAEIAALTSAISTYGTSFTDLVVGLSIGSEDLYRDSYTGQQADAGVGIGPDTLVAYITKVKAALSGTALADVSIGHVDTWTAWVNGSNSAVAAACDWIGMDAYPYFQDTEANGIENGKALFLEAYQNTQAMSDGKPVWITETGWPISGDSAGAGIPSLANAKTYWDDVGCGFAFDSINTWWYVLQDAAPTTPNPSFGVIGSTISTTPLYDLSCSNVTSSSTASSTVASSSHSASGVATSVVSAGMGLTPTGSANSGSTNGTTGGSSNYTATTSGHATATATASGSSSSSTAPVSANSGSALAGSAVTGLAGALMAMMLAL